jgi:hypothetical protein
MYAPETAVDQQFEEISKARTSTLNREMVRMRGEGWNVQLSGDHLVASRREAGRSQMERMLIGVGGFMALAYAATIVFADKVADLPGSKFAFLGAAAVVGAVAAMLTSGEAARERRVTVSLDGQGRPFVADQP